MKAGERNIKFDKSFVQRVLHARYRRPERKEVGFLFVETVRVEVSILGNLRRIRYMNSRKDDDN